MKAPAMTCAVCNDSGRRPGSPYFDCTHCDVAAERAALEAWCKETQQRGPSFDDCWAIYLHGKAMALAAANEKG